MRNFGWTTGLVAGLVLATSALAQTEGTQNAPNHGDANKYGAGIGQPNLAQRGAAETGGAAGLSSSLLGNGLPNVSTASSGNVAGVLRYCVQNKFLSGSNASSTLSSLTGKGSVNQSGSAFQAGQKGVLQTGQGGGLSLATMQAPLRARVCDAVLSRARSMR